MRLIDFEEFAQRFGERRRVARFARATRGTEKPQPLRMHSYFSKTFTISPTFF
jgi:hypothetical protein